MEFHFAVPGRGGSAKGKDPAAPTPKEGARTEKKGTGGRAFSPGYGLYVPKQRRWGLPETVGFRHNLIIVPTVLAVLAKT